MIEIRQVKTRKDKKEFIEFPLRLYKDNPYFVPPLYSEEKALFKKDTVYSEQAESVFYIAVNEGKTVGRIQGILQRAANEKWKQKRVRFTRFDCIENQEIANALFKAVETWAKEKGMEQIVGPLGFSDLEREGLLIEGFNEISTFEEQYNYPYYATLIENNGFKKEIDWLEFKLFAPEQADERLERISNKMMEKYELRLQTAKTTREFVKKYKDQLFDVLDATYVDIYQSVPIPPKVKKSLTGSFKFILNIEYAGVILDKNDKMVGFGFAFPSIGKALQKSGGRLTPKAIAKALKSIKKPEVIDLALIGIMPEYRNRAIATAVISGLQKILVEGKVKYAETNLNLETNANIQNQWKAFNFVQHKKRRSFVKDI